MTVRRGLLSGWIAVVAWAAVFVLVSMGAALEREQEMMDKTPKNEKEWKHCLSPEAYKVLREGGTEIPFSGQYYRNKETGVYHCAACGNPLFGSDTKFESGTGWPSFFRPLSPEAVQTRTDSSHGMARTEVRCGKCGSHLGHVFDDGPEPTGLRYCMNSVALGFERAGEAAEAEGETARPVSQTQVATFAAGCFWGVEAEFRKIRGVVSVAVGYTGGHTKDPTYRDVCSDRTGHAEAVQVEYDPAVVSYGELLDAFWSMHDPTTPNRQGPDVGSQYRSAIFYHNEDQMKAAEASKRRLEQSQTMRGRKVVTELAPARDFYRAEEYHQRYIEKHGSPGCHS